MQTELPMKRLSAEAVPRCHLSHASAPIGRLRMARAAVWICEYPYRTMRLSGPSGECGDCPVWLEMERAREAKIAS